MVTPGAGEAPVSSTLRWAQVFDVNQKEGISVTPRATIKDWPLVVTVVNMASGPIFGAVVGIFSYLVGRWLS